MPIANSLKNTKRRKGQIAFAKSTGSLAEHNYIETELKAGRNTIAHALNRLRANSRREWASDPTTIPSLRADLSKLLKVKKKRALTTFEQRFADRLRAEILNEVKIRNKKVKLPQ